MTLVELLYAWLQLLGKCVKLDSNYQETWTMLSPGASHLWKVWLELQWQILEVCSTSLKPNLNFKFGVEGSVTWQLVTERGAIWVSSNTQAT